MNMKHICRVAICVPALHVMMMMTIVLCETGSCFVALAGLKLAISVSVAGMTEVHHNRPAENGHQRPSSRACVVLAVRSLGVHHNTALSQSQTSHVDALATPHKKLC